MGTGDKGATNTENPRNKNDPRGHHPISQTGSEPIKQLAEEKQEGHFNGEDGDPAHDLCGGQLLVIKDMVREVRLGPGTGSCRSKYART